MIGKFHLQSSGHRTEPRIDDGYSYWKFSHAPRDDWAAGHDYADWVRERGGDLDELRESEDRVPTELHQTTWASERSIEFIRQKRDSSLAANGEYLRPAPALHSAQELCRTLRRGRRCRGPIFAKAIWRSRRS